MSKGDSMDYTIPPSLKGRGNSLHIYPKTNPKPLLRMLKPYDPYSYPRPYLP